MLSLPAGLLLLPDPDERTSAQLHRKVRLLALRRLLSFPLEALPAPLARALATLRPPLVDLARQSSAPLLAALGTPDVLNGLLLWERDLFPAAVLLPSLVPDLLAALPADILREPLRWEHPIPEVHVPRLGQRWRFADPLPRAMLVDRVGLSFALAGGGRWSPPQPPPSHVTVETLYLPLHPALPRLHLALVDSNPLSMDEAHPDKAGNAIDLGGRAAEEWRRALFDALEVIRLGLPAWWSALPLSLERLLPVGVEAERHLSASYQEAPNMAYLTLHPDTLTMAEAIIHETQHGRLNTLLWMDAVLQNGQSEWTPSPVRPDMRPLSGVLLAVHAFTPVAALHAALADMGHPLTANPRFQQRRREVLEGNALALQTLEARAVATPVGQRLLSDLRALHDATMFHVEHPPLRPLPSP